MQIGAVLPQTEIGTDMASVRDYAQAMQDLGYQHLVTSDHVLGANPDGHPGWTRPQRHTTVVHEPFVLFGFIAGVAPKLGLLSNVVIMPQRQTVLVAKQAAEVDVLSEGRFRLGLGIGWNAVEFEGLNENFKNRARRFEEQVDLMRKLWSDESISYQGAVPHRHGGRDLPAADPAPDPDLGRSDRRGGRQAGHPDRGRLPAARPDRRQGHVCGDGRARPRLAARGRPRSGHVRHRAAPERRRPALRTTGARWWRSGAGSARRHIHVATSGGDLNGADAHIQRLREAREVLTP